MRESLLCLTAERLEQLDRDELSPAELEQIEVHLTECPDCRRWLEEADAESNWPGEVSAAFAGVGRSPLQSRVEDDVSFNLRRDEHPLAAFIDLLGPTDDPRMLGRIGPYEIVGILGRGGMGVVFKGFDAALNRYVAIKMLLPHLATSPIARKRFAREAQAAAAVVDDHVMAIHSVAEWNGIPYLVMPYGRGVSLQTRLNENGPLEVREILRIAMQTASGLAAAHAQGLVHRDVKPANILLADGVERVALTDFGLARAVDDVSLTQVGVLAGTPQYMSPEQAAGGNVDARSDLFSLGSVMYAMCTGRPPFRADTSHAVLRQIIDEEPKPVRVSNPDIPEWLAEVIARLMAKRPEDRYVSAREVADLLASCLAHVQQPMATPLPESLSKPVPSFAARRRWRFSKGVMGMIAMLGLVLAGLLGLQATEPPDISGAWAGDDWGRVVLTQTKPGEYNGTYTDTLGSEPGAIHLKWSRIERRFNGTWSEKDDRFGELSVRLIGNEVRGALTTDSKSKINPGTPRLSDLAWTRPDASGANDPNSVRLNPNTYFDRGSNDLESRIFGRQSMPVLDKVPHLDRLFKYPGAEWKHDIRQLIQGRWKVEKAFDEEKNWLAQRDGGEAELVVEGDLLKLEFAVIGKPFSLPFKLEWKATASPQPVDVIVDPNGNADRFLGIIECDGDRLRLCYYKAIPHEEKDRPKVFAQGTNIDYFECRRKGREPVGRKDDKNGADNTGQPNSSIARVLEKKPRHSNDDMGVEKLKKDVEGTWIVEQLITSARDELEEVDNRRAEMVLNGDRLVFSCVREGKLGVQVYGIEWKQGSPQPVDLFKNPGRPTHRRPGIIECSGNRLQLCWSLGKDPVRPTELKEGAGRVYLVCRRKGSDTDASKGDGAGASNENPLRQESAQAEPRAEKSNQKATGGNNSPASKATAPRILEPIKNVVDPRPVRDKLQGVWDCTKFFDCDEISRVCGQLSIFASADTLILVGEEGQIPFTRIFNLDWRDAGPPQQVDAVCHGEGAVERFRGIIECEGRMLLICLSRGQAGDEAQRPRDFVPGPNTALIECRAAPALSDDQAGVIEGTLVDDKSSKPVKGAIVSCGLIASGGRGGVTAMTDDAGRYRLAGLWPGVYNVWLNLYENDSQATVIADDGIVVEAGQVATSTMKLIAGRKVSGLVLDQYGKPAEFKTVACYSAARPNSASTVQAMRTDENGTFEFYLPPGRALIYVVPNEQQDLTDSKQVTVAEAEETAPIMLNLHPFERKAAPEDWIEHTTPGSRIVNRESKRGVEGVVLGEDGKPVSGARIITPFGNTVAKADGTFVSRQANGSPTFVAAEGYHVWTGMPTSGDVLEVVLERKKAVDHE